MRRFLFLLSLILATTTHTSNPSNAARERNNAQLLELAQTGNVAGITILLEHKNANVHEQDPQTGNTALHLLALLSHKPRINEAIEAILNKGGNPRTTNSQGKTPGDLAEHSEIQNLLNNY